MSDFYDAFQELKGLEDATFSFDKPGILKLNTFLNMDDNEDNTLIVVDPDAETAEDTQGKDYNGEVILKCDICGGLITKAPEDVVIDEETQKANVEEECPYCFNVGGYDIVGEVKVPETLEYEEVDEFVAEEEPVEETPVVEEDFTGGPVEFVQRVLGVPVYKRGDGVLTATYRGKSVQANDIAGIEDQIRGIGAEERKKLDRLPESKKSLKESEEKTPTDLFKDYLDLTEFALEKDGDSYRLTDLQGGNLGNIESDRFDSAKEIFDRMDDYIYDYYVRPIEEESENAGFELPDGDLEALVNWYKEHKDEYPEYADDFAVLDMIVNHADEVDLSKAVSHLFDESYKKACKRAVESVSKKRALKEGLRSNIIEFPSGDYVYVAVEDGKLYAGGATNTGIFHEYEVDIDGEEPTDAELQDMYDMIVDEHPEYLEESCKKGKRKLKEQISDSAYEVAEILEKEFGNKEKVSMDEFDRAFGRATKKVLGDKEPDEDFETDVRSILSMSGFETEFEGDNEGGLSRLGESCKKGKKKIDESVKIISTLDDYEPWSGAKDTYEAIVDAGKLDALDSYLEDTYPEGLTITELNDLLWFDGDSVLSDLGIYTEDAIDTAIQDAVDEAQGESFTDTDELESFLTSHIEDAMSGVSVSVDISDEEVEITVENTTRSFALTDFTFEEEVEESLKEGKEVEDFYDVVYDTITGQKKIKGTSNPIRGCIKPEQMGIDKETGNMRARCRTEKEAEKVEKYVADMFGDEGVTTTRRKEKYDKSYPFSVVIDVPEDRVLDDIDDKLKKEESLIESVEGVTVTTDTDIVNVDVKDTDGVTVDVQGKDSVDNTEEATIEPVSDETKEEIVANSEEGESEEGAEGEMLSDEFDEFNEEEFDELGESYLKEVYDNVKSFKTTRGVMDKDRIKLEGIIEFNSGKKAKTSFVFEKYMTTPRGKFKLLGENLQLTSRKNAFILTGSIQERKLCMEALTYKYTAKDAKGGKSKQVYGTKKVTK